MKQVLTIAGMNSDCSQGIPIDLYTFFKENLYAMSVQTAVVAGRFDDMAGLEKMSVSFVSQQLAAVREIGNFQAIKTGILINEPVLPLIIDFLQAFVHIPKVIDPVFVTKYGEKFISEQSLRDIKERLIPLADVLTPNFFEAQLLADMRIQSPEDERACIRKIQALGAKNVVIKRVNLYEKCNTFRDLVLTETGEISVFENILLQTLHTNGAGDTLSATITAKLAQNLPVEEAIKQGIQATYRALGHELPIGKRYGPVNSWA